MNISELYTDFEVIISLNINEKSRKKNSQVLIIGHKNVGRKVK